MRAYPVRDSIDWKAAGKLYEQGHSMPELAERYGCSATTVAKYMPRAGTKARRFYRPLTTGWPKVPHPDKAHKLHGELYLAELARSDGGSGI